MPVGTEYPWYVLAHQNVAKLSANDYTTSLTGLTFKIAHKRAGRDTWSATPRTQRKRMIMFLQTVIADLRKQTDREGDVISPQRRAASPRERSARARRSTAKPAAPARPRTARTSARRHAGRTRQVAVT